jgi:hypothetical protein
MTEPGFELVPEALHIKDHPDNEEEMELAPDAEVDELVKDIDPSAPTLTGEEYV